MSRARVAVVGGGLGGLAAAGLLARAGTAVTLFEAEARLGGKVGTLSTEGLVLDTGPTLLALPDVVRDTFAALGADDLLPRLRELAVHCEYRVADGRRFTVTRDLGRLAAEAEAMAPGDGAGLRAFYAEAEAIHRHAGAPYLEAPFEGPLAFARAVARRGWPAVRTGLGLGTLAGLAARHFRSAAFRQFAGRFATYAGASPYQASAAYAQIAHLERAHGVHHVEGGLGALVSALAAALRRLGVTVATGARASVVARGPGFVVGPSGGEAAFDAVVVNADPLGALAVGPVALSGYVCLLGARERLPLAHHTILFSPDDRAEFDALFAGRPAPVPTVHLCHPAATDAAIAAPGMSGLYLMVNAPPLPPGATDDPATVDVMRARALARLDAAFPGLASQVHVLGERTPADFARQGAPRGSLYGFLPHGRLAPFRRPRMRGAPSGLFYAGGGTHPGGGVPLVLLSGRFAAGMALEHLHARRLV